MGYLIAFLILWFSCGLAGYILFLMHFCKLKRVLKYNYPKVILLFFLYVLFGFRSLRLGYYHYRYLNHRNLPADTRD
jgi:hypothetical protein